MTKVSNEEQINNANVLLAAVFLPKCGKSKWKQKFVSELCTCNNTQLLEYTLSAQQPDDWDGLMSKSGEWMAKISLQILEYKLQIDGWLPKNGN